MQQISCIDEVIWNLKRTYMKDGRVSSAITRATLSERIVQKQDLCAREANFHQFCRKLFKPAIHKLLE